LFPEAIDKTIKLSMISIIRRAMDIVARYTASALLIEYARNKKAKAKLIRSIRAETIC